MKTPAAPSVSSILSKSPKIMAEILSSHDMFPEGPTAGLRMLTVYSNFCGNRLNPVQRQNLERTRELLTGRTAQIKRVQPAGRG